MRLRFFPSGFTVASGQGSPSRAPRRAVRGARRLGASGNDRGAVAIEGRFGGGRSRRTGRSPRAGPCSDRAAKGAFVSYLTDGVHLYERIGWCQNFGLAGGGWLTVRDCRTGAVRTMCELELALCEPIPRGSTMSR